jgi:FixJ family two-component response regulator
MVPGSPECVYVVDADEVARNRLVAQVAELAVPCKSYTSSAWLVRVPAESSGCVIAPWSEAGQHLLVDFRAAGITLPVIFLASGTTVEDAVLAMKAGAFGFMVQPVATQHLLDVVHRAIVESRRRAAGERTRRARLAQVDSLSPREREVLTLVAAGHTSTVVAARLGITKRTVESHRYRINRKLGLHSREELISFAGMIPPSGILERAQDVARGAEFAESEPRARSVRADEVHRREAR